MSEENHHGIGSMVRRASTCLQEWKDEPIARPSMPDDERVRKLERLEERLPGGDISEETYERPRRKYEG